MDFEDISVSESKLQETSDVKSPTEIYKMIKQADR